MSLQRTHPRFPLPFYGKIYKRVLYWRVFDRNLFFRRDPIQFSLYDFILLLLLRSLHGKLYALSPLKFSESEEIYHLFLHFRPKYELITIKKVMAQLSCHITVNRNKKNNTNFPDNDGKFNVLEVLSRCSQTVERFIVLSVKRSKLTQIIRIFFSIKSHHYIVNVKIIDSWTPPVNSCSWYLNCQFKSIWKIAAWYWACKHFFSSWDISYEALRYLRY